MINQESARVRSEYGYEVAIPSPVNPWLIYLGWVLIGSVTAIITTLLLVPLALAENISLSQLGSTVLNLLGIGLVAVLGGLLIQRAFAVKWYLWAAVTAGISILMLIFSTLGTTALSSALDDAPTTAVGAWFSIYSIGYTLFGGLIIGAAQAWLLHKTTSYAVVWIIGTTLIRLILNLCYGFVIEGVYDATAPLIEELSSNTRVLLATNITSTVNTIVAALLTGLVLIFLLYANRNRHRYGQRGTA